MLGFRGLGIIGFRSEAFFQAFEIAVCRAFGVQGAKQQKGAHVSCVPQRL